MPYETRVVRAIASATLASDKVARPFDVATSILGVMGGRSFLDKVGATDLVRQANSVFFRMDANKSKADSAKIEYDVMGDRYTLSFWVHGIRDTWGGLSEETYLDLVREFDRLFEDQVLDTFARFTGFAV